MRAVRAWLGMASLAMLVALGSAAPASANEDESEAIAKRVYASDNIPEAVGKLSNSDRRTFLTRLDKWTAVTSESPAVRRKPTAQEARMGADELAGGGCWSKYKYTEWWDLGLHTGDTWMTAHWCANSSRITSYSLTNRGGQGYKGISYVGLGSTYVQNLGWEVRQAQQFKFSIIWATAQPCMQIRSGKTGLYSYQSNCNLS